MAAEGLLALNLYHEARGEGSLGMLAVGWVVLNRLADPRFPGTIEGIILQGSGGDCQWAWVCDDAGQPKEERSWHLALQLARQILTDPPPDPTAGALWFRPVSAGDPKWGTRIARTVQIGNHIFYGRAAATVTASTEDDPQGTLLAGR
jgi:spore germination cell wall hydrolase CwlJ-like protein